MSYFIPKDVANSIKASINETIGVPKDCFFENLPTSSNGYSIVFEYMDGKDILTCSIVLTPEHIVQGEPNRAPLFVNIEAKLRRVDEEGLRECFREMRFCRISTLSQTPMVLFFLRDATVKVLEHSDSDHIWRGMFEEANPNDEMGECLTDLLKTLL